MSECKTCKFLGSYGSAFNPKWYCKLSSKSVRLNVYPWIEGENKKCPLGKEVK